MAKKLKIESMVILGKFSDKKIRQILIYKEMRPLIEQILSAKTGSIMVIETPIEDIDIIKKNNYYGTNKSSTAN